MKKIMIIAAAAMMASLANAASIKWGFTTAAYNAGGKSLVTSGTAYLVDAAALSRQALLTAMQSGNELADAVADAAVMSGAIGANGKITSTTLTTDAYAGGQLVSFYTVFAAADGKTFFMTALSDKTIVGTGSTNFTWAMSTITKGSVISGATADAAGWYNAGIPEPTSALLLVLGMAGLALRRRQA